jgi:hypothetical protein
VQGPAPDRRRSADRILDTAEGVLITLRRYHLNQAFFELAQTARRHAIPPVSLADALVALHNDNPPTTASRGQFRSRKQPGEPDGDDALALAILEQLGNACGVGLGRAPAAPQPARRHTLQPAAIRWTMSTTIPQADFTPALVDTPAPARTA